MNLPEHERPTGWGTTPLAAEAALAPRRVDPWPWVILLFFILASAVMVALMWDGYRIGTFAGKAEEMIAAERYAEAIPYLKYLVGRQRYAWVRQRQLAQCYLETNEPEKAIEHLKLVERYSDVPLDVEYGIAWHLQGKTKESAESLERALARDPSDAAAHFYLGVQAQAAGRLEEAATHFQGTASDPKWDRRAHPHRQQLADAVLGDVAPQLAVKPAEVKEGP